MRTAQFIEESKAAKPESVSPSEHGKKQRVRGNPDKIKPYRWKAGESGNPGGRPKGDQFKQLAQFIIENMGPKEFALAADGFRKQLYKGNAYAFNVLSDRAYGKLTEKIDLSVEAGIVEKLTAARARVKK